MLWSDLGGSGGREAQEGWDIWISEYDIDAVIFATGYSFAFPFLEDSVQVVKNKVSLYKKVFPPNLEKPTLAIIGLIQPLGAIMPISELQGRWATQVFKVSDHVRWLPDYLAVCLIIFMFLLINSQIVCMIKTVLGTKLVLKN